MYIPALAGAAELELALIKSQLLPVTNRDAGDEAALDSNQVISGCYRTLRTTPNEAPSGTDQNSAIGRKANWRCFRRR
jgi:hypothetical protein